MTYEEVKINVLRQVNPEIWYGTIEDIISYALYSAVHEEGVELTTDLNRLRTGDEWTIESIERAYDLGYDAIINDGQLIGFKKAV